MRLALLASALALVVAGCGGSVAERGAAPRGAGPAELVPADAALYVGVVTDADSAAWKRLDALLGRFPDGDRLLSALAGRLGADGVDWDRDVRPALGPVTALVALPRSGQPVALTKPPLKTKLEALLGRSDRPFATASLDDGWVAIAERRATLDAYRTALDGPRLADDDTFGEAVGDLPDDALATVFVRASGLAGGWTAYAPTAPVPAMPPLPTGGFDWFAAALTPTDDGLELRGEVRADSKLAGYEPTLLRRVPADAILSASFHGGEKTFERVTGDQGIGPFLDGFQQALGVDVDELLALVKGQGVAYVRPGLPIPEVTLAAENDDEEQAVATVDRVARALGGHVETTTVDGVETHAARFDKFRIAWSAADGVLLVSNGPSALRDFRSDGAKLVDEASFRRAAEHVGLGDDTSGLVYVDARRLGELIDGLAGVAGQELPPALGRNLRAAESLVLAADGTRFHGFLSVPDR